MVARGLLSFALAASVSSCAHTPPLAETSVSLNLEYLRGTPVAGGELQHVRDGVWCSDDDAFSIPLVPYPDGPVTIHDPYQGWGITCSLDMYDSRESVLQIVRTRIRSDLPQSEVMGRVESNLRAKGEGVPMISTAWVTQRGRRQLQQVNTAPVYDGRSSAVYLQEGQSYSVGERSEGCRVDRHFAEIGYYFQIIAVAHRVDRPTDPCKVAREMAAWAAENIAIGQGCGPKASPKS